MRIYSIVLATFIAVLLVASFVAAQEASADTSVSTDSSVSVSTNGVADDLSGDAGVTPDSSFYGLKLGWEKAGLWFTFNQEKKAERELALADKRLVEARVMAEKGNAEGFARAQEAHDELVARAQARIDALDQDGNADNIRNSARKVVGLQRAIEVHKFRIETLKDIEANANLTDEQRAKFDEVIAKMENKTDDMREKLDDRKDKMKTRLRAVTEENESEIDKEFKEFDGNLTLVKQRIALHLIARTEFALTKLDQTTVRNNNSVFQDQLTLAQNALVQAKALYAAGDYEGAIKAIKPVSNYGRNLSIIVRARNEERKAAAEEIRSEVRDKVEARIKSRNDSGRDDSMENESNDSDSEEMNASANVSVDVTA